MGVLRRLILANPLAPYDPDARAYIQAVERADGQALETGVRAAIDAFVRGCKADGIWNAINASCILAGARTLSGALVPLKGPAPTNYNFTGLDYNRKTGLLGDGATKYLDSNRNNSADPQDNNHNAVYATQVGSGAFLGAGGSGSGANNLTSGVVRNRSTSSTSVNVTTPFIGSSRSASASYVLRVGGVNGAIVVTSQVPYSNNVTVFNRAISPESGLLFSSGRLAYYSIGEALDLALLDARVTTLVNTLSSVIS